VPACVTASAVGQAAVLRFNIAAAVGVVPTG
jgi:hypothetical protein